MEDSVWFCASNRHQVLHEGVPAECLGEDLAYAASVSIPTFVHTSSSSSRALSFRSNSSYFAVRPFRVTKPNPIHMNRGIPPNIPMRSHAPSPTAVPGITISKLSTGTSAELERVGSKLFTSSVSAQPSLSSSVSALSPSPSPS